MTGWETDSLDPSTSNYAQQYLVGRVDFAEVNHESRRAKPDCPSHIQYMLLHVERRHMTGRIQGAPGAVHISAGVEGKGKVRAGVARMRSLIISHLDDRQLPLL